ncbi:MAG: hypothetical protein IJD20_00850 [Oscillospiraceae bacterium]|nr:hypothetical protein [Oscillospiraceae bacterium]
MQNGIRIPGIPLIHNQNIRSARAMLDTSLSGRSLDVDTFTATITTSFSLDNVSHEQAIRIQRGGTQVGVFYLDSVSQLGAQVYKLQMVSPLGLLERRGHVGGCYANKNAQELIEEICGDVSVSVEAPFNTATVNGWLPYVSPADENGAQSGTAKDNLMQVLFAINASLRADENGTLHVCNQDARTTSVIDADRIFRGSYEIEHSQPVSEIVLTEHSFADVSATATENEREVLFDGTATAGQRVIFSAPMSGLRVTGTLTITDSGANYAILGAGTGTLTGIPYLHLEREIAQAVTVGAAMNKVTISDATLVGILNSGSVMARLSAYYAQTKTLTADVLLDWERPGDVISIFDKITNSMLTATIAKISPENYSQTLRGTISALVGFLPWNEGSYTDHADVLTGSGSFIVPAGVTTLTVVLIGGGAGGGAGADGEDAPITEQAVSSPFYGGHSMVGAIYPKFPTYGKGGTGGVGGNAGNVLRATITVSPGDAIVYACGVGGAGASAGGDQETPGSDGTATTFGAASSASGDAVIYVDPSDGTTYGGEGSPGIAGGDGGGYESEEEAITPTPTRKAGGSVTYGGVTFNAGADGARRTEQSQSDGRTYVQDGSFGGGAAVGAAGVDGTDGEDPLPVANWHAIGGGNGADAAAPETAFYGRGGAGGNGGGGGGSAGWWGRTSGTTTIAGAQQGAGLGGAGSAGGRGGDGCIIVYYRTPNA